MLSEQPHYTTAVLDAGEVYHIGVGMRVRLRSGAETPTPGPRHGIVLQMIGGLRPVVT
jgi:hypothetical protein